MRRLLCYAEYLIITLVYEYPHERVERGNRNRISWILLRIFSEEKLEHRFIITNHILCTHLYSLLKY